MGFSIRVCLVATILLAMARSHEASDCPVFPDLVEPKEVASVDGELNVTLSVRAHRTVGCMHYNTRVYFFNGEPASPGPTLRVRPGDRVKIRLINELGDDEQSAYDKGGRVSSPYDLSGVESAWDLLDGNGHPNFVMHGCNTTNIHTHGLLQDPAIDTIFGHVLPGTERTYSYTVLGDMFPTHGWYHAHKHGSVALHVMNGLLGTVFVDGQENSELSLLRSFLLVVERRRFGMPSKSQCTGSFNSPYVDESFEDMYEAPSLEQLTAEFSDWAGGCYLRPDMQVSPAYSREQHGEMYGIDLDPIGPPCKGCAEHSLYQDSEYPKGDYLYDYYTVNGQYRPLVAVRTGEWVRLRIGHADGFNPLPLGIYDYSTSAGSDNGTSYSRNALLTHEVEGRKVIIPRKCECAILGRDGVYRESPLLPDEGSHVCAWVWQFGRADIAVRCREPGAYDLVSLCQSDFGSDYEALEVTSEACEAKLLRLDVKDRLEHHMEVSKTCVQDLHCASELPRQIRDTGIARESGSESKLLHDLMDRPLITPPVSFSFMQHSGGQNSNPCFFRIQSHSDRSLDEYMRSGRLGDGRMRAEGPWRGADGGSDGTLYFGEVLFGEVHEWTHVMGMAHAHPIHFHSIKFQVVSCDFSDPFGVLWTPGEWRDVFPALPGSCTLRFVPNYEGSHIVHCHALFHEDRGMMSMFNVVADLSDRGKLYESCFDVWNSLSAEGNWKAPDADDPDWLLMGKEGKGCSWVAQDPTSRCLQNPCPDIEDDASCQADGAFIADCNAQCDEFCVDPTAEPLRIPEGVEGPLSKSCSFFCESRAQSCTPSDPCMSELSIPFRSAVIMCPSTCQREENEGKESGSLPFREGRRGAVSLTVLLGYMNVGR